MYMQIWRAKKSLYNFEEQCVCGEGADSLTLAEIMTHYKVTVMKKTVWYNTKMDIKTNGEQNTVQEKSPTDTHESLTYCQRWPCWALRMALSKTKQKQHSTVLLVTIWGKELKPIGNPLHKNQFRWLTDLNVRSKIITLLAVGRRDYFNEKIS